MRQAESRCEIETAVKNDIQTLDQGTGRVKNILVRAGLEKKCIEFNIGCV